MSRSASSVSRAGAVRARPLGRAVLDLVAVGVVLLVAGLVLGLGLVGRHGGGANQGWATPGGAGRSITAATWWV